MQLNRMTLTDVSLRLKVKDARTAEKWCKQNGVTIICEDKRKYVWDMEFEVAFRNKFLKLLEKINPNNYMEIYHSAVNDDFLRAYQVMKSGGTNNYSTDYYPIGDSGKKFIEGLED